MKNINKSFFLILFLIASMLIIGVVVYRNYNSVENKSKRALRDDVTSWYYNSISITRDKPDRLKSDEDKSKAITIFKITNSLKDDYVLLDEGYNTTYLGYTAVIIDTFFLFENEKSSERYYFSNRYYYDLNEIIPVPLTEDITLIDNNGKTKKRESLTLWNGDFDSWCIKNKEAQELISDCINHQDKQFFKEPIQIVWTAKFDGCLVSCWGASFTRVPEDSKYPRFAGYMPESGERIADEYMKDGQTLKIYGKMTDISGSYGSVFGNRCVPTVEIEKIEVVKQ